MFYAEGIDMVRLEERLKKWEEYESFSQLTPPEETKEIPKEKLSFQEGVNLKWGAKPKRGS